MFQKNKDYSSFLTHIAIIMDGNGRWAKKRGMPRSVGHTAGAKTFRTISEHCRLCGVKHLTVYAFSTENWKRPKDEVDAIMKLLRDYIDEVFRNKDKYLKKNMRVKFIGNIDMLDNDIITRINEMEKTTQDCSGMTLNIAVNYGGRDDIVHATKEITKQIQLGNLTCDDIDENLINKYLYTESQPDPDIILRTGGESRISNFLIWQSAYAEYIFTNTLWPDFKPKEFDSLIEQYKNRDRRFGGI